MLVRSSSIMAEAYGFGLPGYQKSLMFENYGMLKTRNVLTGDCVVHSTVWLCLCATETVSDIFDRTSCLKIRDALILVKI